MNSDRQKVYYSDARHLFYINSPSLSLIRPLLYFPKNFKCVIKSKKCSIKYDSMSIFYQNSSVTPSKVYCSNTRYLFCKNLTLLPLRAALHLRKNSKFDMKAVYLSVRYDSWYVNIVLKFRFSPIKNL